MAGLRRQILQSGSRGCELDSRTCGVESQACELGSRECGSDIGACGLGSLAFGLKILLNGQGSQALSLDNLVRELDSCMRDLESWAEGKGRLVGSPMDSRSVEGQGS